MQALSTSSVWTISLISIQLRISASDNSKSKMSAFLPAGPREKDPQRRLVLVIPCLSSKLVQNVFHHALSRYRVPSPNPCRFVGEILGLLCPLLVTIGAVFHHRAWTLNLAKCLAQAIRSFRLWDHHLNAVRPCAAHMVEPLPISHQQLRCLKF